MALDTAHFWQLLDEVASTNGDATARKSEELLNYVTGYVNGRKKESATASAEPTDTASQKNAGESRGG